MIRGHLNATGNSTTLTDVTKAKADPACPYVFPGARTVDARNAVAWAPLKEIKRVWLAVCVKAGLAELVESRDGAGGTVAGPDGVPVRAWKATVRIHDLRHTYASILASSGLSLPIIGALLGQTQAATTARYAHLLDTPLRAATEVMGSVVECGSRGTRPQRGPSSLNGHLQGRKLDGSRRRQRP